MAQCDYDQLYDWHTEAGQHTNEGGNKFPPGQIVEMRLVLLPSNGKRKIVPDQFAPTEQTKNDSQ